MSLRLIFSDRDLLNFLRSGSALICEGGKWAIKEPTGEIKEPYFIGSARS